MSTAASIVDREAGLVRVQPRRTKLALVGGVTPLRVGIPWDDESWEIWGANFFWTSMPRATRWFEIHIPSVLTAAEKRAVAASTVPVYMRRAYPWAPLSVRFPIERVLDSDIIGTNPPTWLRRTEQWANVFTCTFCFQLALAITEGFDEIGLWGIDFSRGSARERTVEWRGVAYWLGVAQGLGTKVTLPKGCTLLDHGPRYGLDYWDEVFAVRQQLAELRWLLMGQAYDDFDNPEIAEIPASARRRLAKSAPPRFAARIGSGRDELPSGARRSWRRGTWGNRLLTVAESRTIRQFMDLVG